MANLGNKHKSKSPVREWGSKNRKYDHKRNKRSSKTAIRKEVENEFNDEINDISVIKRIK